MAPSPEINDRLGDILMQLSTKDSECDKKVEKEKPKVYTSKKPFDVLKKTKKSTKVDDRPMAETVKVPIKTEPETGKILSRREEAAAIRNKFPTKIPIIVERFHKETSLPCLDKSKFLVPQEITMSQFVTIIRNRMKLSSNQAFYLLVNNRSMLSLSKTLIEVYREHKEDDGFLYVTYASQEVFG